MPPPDKIVGKAAALLYALMGIEALYAEVLSEGAEDVLRRFRILTEYEKIVPAIINRKGDGICPMEEAVKETEDPLSAFEILQKRIGRSA